MKCLWTVFRRFHHTEQQNHMETSWLLCWCLFSHLRKIMLILMFRFVIKMLMRIAYWKGVPIAYWNCVPIAYWNAVPIAYWNGVPIAYWNSVPILKMFIICDFRLLPRSIWQPSSSGLIRYVMTQKSTVLTFIILPHCLSTDYVHMTLQCPELYIFERVYVLYIYIYHMHYCNSCSIPGSVK